MKHLILSLLVIGTFTQTTEAYPNRGTLKQAKENFIDQAEYTIDIVSNRRSEKHETTQALRQLRKQIELLEDLLGGYAPEPIELRIYRWSNAVRKDGRCNEKNFYDSVLLTGDADSDKVKCNKFSEKALNSNASFSSYKKNLECSKYGIFTSFSAGKVYDLCLRTSVSLQQ